MRTSIIARGILVGMALLASAALTLPGTSPAKTPLPPPPRATTGSVAHVRGSSALLQGVVNPRGAPTTYYFQFGPTIAYGSVTPTTSVGSGTVGMKVGQPVTGFLSGYHYRIVATSPNGTGFGKDRTFGVMGSTRLRFELTKVSEPVVLGRTAFVSGVMAGLGGANHMIALQESPYPYLEPFINLGAAQATNAVGAFSFRVARLMQSTQFRVVSLDPLPLYSPVLTQHVAVRVTFKVRSASRRGFVRLYGTVTPAEVGAHVVFQVQKAVRPGKSEVSVRFVSQASTVVKRATKTFSRFSIVTTIRTGGRYRAFVRIKPGALVSGFSQTIVIHASPASTLNHRKKH